MSKKHFIALADKIRYYNEVSAMAGEAGYTPEQLANLAAFCYEQNPQFKRDRWLGYIAGANGQNGGKVKA